ncbi:hypothetical protein [Flagellimonas sp. 2504JD1-5]
MKTTSKENGELKVASSSTFESDSNPKELPATQDKIFYLDASKYYDFLYHPYNFELDVDELKKLLGDEVEVKKKEVAEDDYSDAYTFYTINYQETKLTFYDYEGKHSATITTPLLPMINGIRIGMDHKDFLKAIKLEKKEAPKANTYSIFDEYGSIDFSFRADTLYLIKGYYEEGD